MHSMPACVDTIIVVDDSSSDRTSEAALEPQDPRVHVVRHQVNLGLGASLVTGHRYAMADGAEISVVMAGDGQMDPSFLPNLLDPLIDNGYDFSKGNRFFSSDSMRSMPRHRIVGNVLLTFLTKAATGYWNLVDPQNGYTAMSQSVQVRIDWPKVATDYSYENDVIAQLGMLRARIIDVDIPAVYGNEVSDIRLATVVPSILRTLTRAFWRRFWQQHVLRSFSPIAAFAMSGALLLTWSVAFGAWVIAATIGEPEASTGTVMLFVLPFFMGFALLLASWVLDIMNTPT